MTTPAPTPVRATTPVTATTDLPGFAHPVHDAQQVFRAVLEATSFPTRQQTVDVDLRVPAPLGTTAAAIALTLCDETTPVWLDPALATAEVSAWLAFHAGIRTVEDPQQALFAFAGTPDGVPPLEALATGSDEEPHLSATLVVDTTGRSGDAGTPSIHTASGPGLKGPVTWHGAGLPETLLSGWAANHALFPRGVDVLVVDDDARTVTGLPRTTALVSAARTAVTTAAADRSPSADTEGAR
ncbi:phosphonate C-P lyase system protein PhnH [Brevibacterium litoralis]|uniref:phosphonate C-P lyase system protein PhnH n=1 Tax=Brevibacterium litoralis TaxID=3138935 RepID=UPI0032EEC053